VKTGASIGASTAVYIRGELMASEDWASIGASTAVYIEGELRCSEGLPVQENWGSC